MKSWLFLQQIYLPNYAWLMFTLTDGKGWCLGECQMAEGSLTWDWKCPRVNYWVDSLQQDKKRAGDLNIIIPSTLCQLLPWFCEIISWLKYKQCTLTLIIPERKEDIFSCLQSFSTRLWKGECLQTLISKHVEELPSSHILQLPSLHI